MGCVFRSHPATRKDLFPGYPKRPCALLLHRDRNNKPVHVVWGIAKDFEEPAVLVTAYRPDPERWDETFKRRR